MQRRNALQTVYESFVVFSELRDRDVALVAQRSLVSHTVQSIQHQKLSQQRSSQSQISPMASSSLSEERLTEYVQHIGLPAKYHPASNPTHDLAFLTQLHVHTISTIPYDNLTLHYSASKRISIDPQDAFRKIVTERRGRGGYCMENRYTTPIPHHHPQL